MRKALIRILAFILAAASMSGLSGCLNTTKDSVLKLYNGVITGFGNHVLTEDNKLTGKRTFGSDRYVGSYNAEYNGFSGTEYLFGGTSIGRETGGKVSIVCNLSVSDGSAALLAVSGSDDPQVLLDTSGEYTQTFDIPQSGWYIEFAGSGFTGTLELKITDGKDKN